MFGFPNLIELVFDTFEADGSSNYLPFWVEFRGDTRFSLDWMVGFCCWGEDIYCFYARVMVPPTIFFSEGPGELSLLASSWFLLGVLLLILGIGGFSLSFSWWATSPTINQKKYLESDLISPPLSIWSISATLAFPYSPTSTYYHRLSSQSYCPPSDSPSILST